MKPVSTFKRIVKPVLFALSPVGAGATWLIANAKPMAAFASTANPNASPYLLQASALLTGTTEFNDFFDGVTSNPLWVYALIGIFATLFLAVLAKFGVKGMGR